MLSFVQAVMSGQSGEQNWDFSRQLVSLEEEKWWLLSIFLQPPSECV